MVAFLITLVVIGLLIIAGIAISVHLYARGELGRFRRIRRLRTVRPMPDGAIIDETVEEVVDEKVPVEEEA